MTAICAMIAPDVSAGEWLASWRACGGGTTIGIDSTVHAWWLPTPPHDDDAIRSLLNELNETAGLKAAVRAEVLAKAHARSVART